MVPRRTTALKTPSAPIYALAIFATKFAKVLMLLGLSRRLRVMRRYVKWEILPLAVAWV